MASIDSVSKYFRNVVCDDHVAQCMPGGPLPDPRSIACDVSDPPDNDELKVDLEKLVAVLTRRLFGTLARRAELKLHCTHHFCTAMILT